MCSQLPNAVPWRKLARAFGKTIERFNKYATKSYSQEGEDLVLRRFFESQQSGFYVDVGAHHPFRFSNTYLFYKKGWRGINIDAMPASMRLFERLRPRDINLELPISDKAETLTYYAFNEPALNGFSRDLSNARHGKKGFKIIFQQEMQTSTLAEVFANHLRENQAIDFLSVDVEGLDFEVLCSNDWGRFRPTVVLAELLSTEIESIATSQIGSFMQSVGYVAFAKTMNTVFFRRS